MIFWAGFAGVLGAVPAGVHARRVVTAGVAATVPTGPPGPKDASAGVATAGVATTVRTGPPGPKDVAAGGPSYSVAPAPPCISPETPTPCPRLRDISASQMLTSRWRSETMRFPT